MSPHICIAPLEDGTTCTLSATCVRVFDDLVCHLCQEHAEELDRDIDPRSSPTYPANDEHA
jgi:hypothetical protein